jgi:hypothetical protein
MQTVTDRAIVYTEDGKWFAKLECYKPEAAPEYVWTQQHDNKAAALRAAAELLEQRG